MLCSLSNLDKQDIDQIQKLEGELGQTLLAYSCHDASLADLDAEKLMKIQTLENKLGISLVALNA